MIEAVVAWSTWQHMKLCTKATHKILALVITMHGFHMGFHVPLKIGAMVEAVAAESPLF